MATLEEKYLEIRKAIVDLGFTITSERRLPDDSGRQIRSHNGPIANVYDSGSITLGGKHKEKLMAAPGFASVGAAPRNPNHRNIFVVYGHNHALRTQLEAMLRRWNLEPLVLDQLPSEGQTLIEKLETYRGKCNFAVVLATPDDEGHAAGRPGELTYRARQNVVLELGMLLSTLGRPKVAILIQSSTKMERPSDIQGLIYIPFVDSIEDTKVQLAKEMDSQGIDIDVKRL